MTRFVGNTIPIITAYAFFVAIVNLYIYWNTFDVDIFSHITAYEILSRAIPLTAIGLFVLFGFIIGETATRQMRLSHIEMNEKIDRSIDKKDFDLAKNLIESARSEIKKYEKFYDKVNIPVIIFSYTIFFALLVGGIYFHLLQWQNIHIFLYSLAAASLIQNIINHTKILEHLYKHSNISPMAINASIAFLFITIGSTAANAQNIKDGNEYTQTLAIESKSQLIKEKVSGLALIGETENQVFFWDTKNQSTLRLYRSSITGIETNEYTNSGNLEDKERPQEN